jgi:hypothetical protein
MTYLGGQGGYFETSDMTSERLGEMFKGDSADMCARKFPGGQANGQACADGERGPPSARAEILIKFPYVYLSLPQFTSVYLSLPQFTTVYLRLPQITSD